MNNSKHPEWPIDLLRRICPDHLFEEIAGDLLQTYQTDLTRFGQPRANRRFVWNAIRYCRPEIIFRNRFELNFYPLSMYKHFLAIFFRNAKKDLGYSSINILGLTLAIACFIFIGLWCVDELTFDSFHKNRDLVYQVMGKHQYPDGTFVDSGTPGPLATGLQSLSGIDEACRVALAGDRQLFQSSDKSFYENGIYADASFLNIFTVNMLEGNRQHALNSTHSIIISRTLAQKYFGNESAIGKTIKLGNKLNLNITSVFEELPGNSSLQFDFILPYELYAKEDQYTNEWGAWTGGFTFVKLKSSPDLKNLEEQIHKRFTQPHIWERWDSNVELFLFPMKEWHLYANFTNGEQDGGRIDYVVIFGAVGIFILLMACINFMNLTIARATKRAKEIGVRKVIGARKSSIFTQFVFESILIAAISCLLALMVVALALPFFNYMTAKNVSIPFYDPRFYLALTALVIITGFVAGCYPAILPSSFKALDVLKGNFHGIKAITLRRSLVVFQFTLSVSLIVITIMAGRQIQFIKSKNMGFDRHNIIYFNSTAALSEKFDVFRNEAMKNPLMMGVSQANANPMAVQSGMVLGDNAWPGKRKEDNIVFRWIQCDHDFIPTLGFNIIEGRNFIKENVADSANYIISEEAARQMGLKEPIGQPLTAPHPGRIIGVVKDFHSVKLQFGIQPVIIAMKPVRTEMIFVEYQEAQAQNAIAYLEDLYKKFEPNFPMEWKMMDDPMELQYRDESLVNNLTIIFTTIAIVISCLGLVGLVTYTTEIRGKEIGIRKVMGASIVQILTLLSKEFLTLVSIAFVLGIALGWFASEKYLIGYAFRINIDIWTIVLTAALLIIATLLAVSVQSAKAAMSNPVKTLRND